MLSELMYMNNLQYHKPICMTCQHFVKCPSKQPNCREYLEDEEDEHIMNT